MNSRRFIDHLVGKQRKWFKNRESEGLGGLEIDPQYPRGDGDVSGLGRLVLPDPADWGHSDGL